MSIVGLLETALVSELVFSSDELWLVSPWISDIAVVDNSRGDYDGLLADGPARRLSLAEVLGLVSWSGTQLRVVTRTDDHNAVFLRRLARLAPTAEIVQHDDLHEKSLVGDDWMITGSMNFTFKGLQVNDEAVTYKFDPAAAAATRVDLRHRWMP